jgi:hypothetical protein
MLSLNGNMLIKLRRIVKMKKEKYEHQTFDELVDKVPLALAFIPVLKLLAIRGETMTYKELGQLFNLHYRAVPSYLRILDIYCQTHRLPHLNHLVVHQLSQVSGGANFTDAPTNFHDQLIDQEKIYNHDWLSAEMPNKATLYKDVAKMAV